MEPVSPDSGAVDHELAPLRDAQHESTASQGDVAYVMASQQEHGEDIIIVTPVKRQSPVATSKGAGVSDNVGTAMLEKRCASLAPTFPGGPSPKRARAADPTIVISSPGSPTSSDGDWGGEAMASFVEACEAAEACAEPEAARCAPARVECPLCGSLVSTALLPAHQLQVCPLRRRTLCTRARFVRAVLSARPARRCSLPHSCWPFLAVPVPWMCLSMHVSGVISASEIWPLWLERIGRARDGKGCDASRRGATHLACDHPGRDERDIPRTAPSAMDQGVRCVI